MWCEIPSRQWVDCRLARCCWISNHLASHFIQGVSRLLSHKVLLNFWQSCITFHPASELTVISPGVVAFLWSSCITFCAGSESTVVLQGIFEFLTISHHILSREWVDHRFMRCCWISDHLASHFVQAVCRLLFHKMLLNYLPSCITLCPDGVSTIIMSCLVIFLTIQCQILSREWVRLVDALSSSGWLPFTTARIHGSSYLWPLFQCWYIYFSIFQFPESCYPFYSHQHGPHLQVRDILHVKTFCFSQH